MNWEGLGALLSKDLAKNIKAFREKTCDSYDVKLRELRVQFGGKLYDACVFFLDGLVDTQAINDSVIKPLLQASDRKIDNKDLLDFVHRSVIRNLDVNRQDSFEQMLDSVYCGDSVLLIDGFIEALVLDTKRWEHRGVESATTEQVISGAKDSFCETLKINSMLIRRRIKSNSLKMEYLKLGRLTKTDTLICYIDGVVNPKLLDEVRARISRIDTDNMSSLTLLEEFIEDSSFSLLPQVIKTERPDKSSAHLLEGGVVVAIDGTPAVLLLPVVFWQFIYSPEDYNERIYTSFLLRTLRLVALLLALMVPGLYVAVTSFHHEMIPVGLLGVIIEGRQGVPFPILLEVLIMELILEIIREAGVRLPINVGQAISIVGALVLGQAAIMARLASPATVTIVALAAVANFTLPNFSAGLAIRNFRFVFFIVSGFFGLLGFICVFFITLTHFCSLRSFGVPFMTPISPLSLADLKDSQIRMPAWALSKRPSFLRPRNLDRQKQDLKPGVNKGESNTNRREYNA